MNVVVAYRPDKNSDLLLTRAINEAKNRRCPLTLLNIAPDDAFMRPGRLTEAEASELQKRLTLKA